ncbi:MAG: GDP-fucose synthetase [Desulfuromonas sp.]|nr:MAG: GDP-fucose synthetase [Desulfuromonas sp.]
MNLSSKIYVAGHQGMVGRAIVRKLEADGFNNLLLRGRDVLDLCDQRAVSDFFASEKPDYVFLAAAKVGGIHANNSYPAEFIHDNLVIQSNIIHSAWRTGVERLLFLGSSCIYPKLAPQPMNEDALLTGLLEPTNEPYALAKIAGIKLCESYNRQYGTKFVSVMPTNLYGPFDNFDLQSSHVLPALMRKLHEAKLSGADSVEVWGSGTPKREFLHVDDMAAACFHIMQLPDDLLAAQLLNYPEPSFANVGTGVDLTIRELAETISEVVGFAGELVFDPSKPDGTPRKLLDVSRLEKLGWSAEVDLKSGIESTYRWFRENFSNT